MRYAFNVQVSQTGSVRSRARRWARVIDSYTWPEILKRYLLTSRRALFAWNHDGALHLELYFAKPGQFQPGLSICGGSVYSIPIEDMDDSQAALRAAKDLTRMPYYKLDPNLHLRLLHTLCNDIVSCQGFKDFMAARIEETYRLQAQKHQADADVGCLLHALRFLWFIRDYH